MANAAANWEYDEQHKARPFHDGTFTRWSAKQSRRFPYHYRDGVTVWVSTDDLTPDDDFLGGPTDKPPGELDL